MADPSVIYAIGDVHGEADRLARLHRLILERHKARFGSSPMRIVHLGDYIDRGPDSCGVVETIMALEASGACEVVSLRGNHEQMMLDGPRWSRPAAHELWLRNGGTRTMQSYRKRGFDAVPVEHLAWIARRPLLHVERKAKLIFVHAGLDVDVYPACSDVVRLWTRSKSFFDSAGWTNPALDGWRVVHGHTPTESSYPDIDEPDGRRINLDTGAVYGGRLTAAVFAPGAEVSFLYA